MSAFTEALTALNTSAAVLTAEYEALEPRVTTLEAWTAHVTSEKVIRLKPGPSAGANVTNIRAALLMLEAGKTTPWAWGGVIVFAAGTYPLNEQIDIRNFWGIRLIGESLGVEFVWQGPPAQSMFVLSHSRQFEIASIRFRFETDGYSAIQIRRDNIAPAVTVPTFGHVHDLYIDCNNRAQYGIVVGGTEYVDANNDFHSFDRVEVSAYKTAAWYTTGWQSYGLRMTNCRTYAGNTGAHTLLNGGPSLGSAFSWQGGSIFGNLVADFQLNGTYQSMAISDVNSEGSKRFLICAPNSRLRDVTLQRIRWSAGALDTDGRAIIAEDNISLEMSHCTFGDGGGTTKALLFDFGAGTSPYHAVEMRFCTLFSTAARMWSRSAPILGVGNKQIVSETTMTYQPIQP